MEIVNWRRYGQATTAAAAACRTSIDWNSLKVSGAIQKQFSHDSLLEWDPNEAVRKEYSLAVKVSLHNCAPVWLVSIWPNK